MPEPTPKNPIGPTGRRAAQTVAALREGDRLSYRELSDRLRELGRPIPTLGLSRIERGERRIDADDLMALAIASGATPDRLLLPVTTRRDVDVALTPEVEVSEEEAWSWATALTPLESHQGVVPVERVHQFRSRNAPHYEGYDLPEIAAHLDVISEIVTHVRERARERHLHPASVLSMVSAVVFAAPNDDGTGGGEFVQ